MVITAIGAGCGVSNPLFFRIVANCTKIFTPDAPDFPRVFRTCHRKVSENHDFYPTARLRGGFIAM
jgi:hypothetical protein